MKLRAVCLPLIVTLLVAATARGQGTTIQLPTFRYTTVTTTVSVPDQGSAYLGGIKRASESSVSRGVPILGKMPFANRLFTNRGIGREVGASHMHVTATIIDHNEMDEMILGRAAAMRPGVAAVSETDRRAAYLSRNVARNRLEAAEEAVARRAPSVEEIRQRNEAAQQERDSEAQFFYAKGRKAQAAGKNTLAKTYYQMAARRATGPFKTVVLARLDAVTLGGTSKLAAKNE